MMSANDLPSIAYLRAASSPAGVPVFHVDIVIGPGFLPMDMRWYPDRLCPHAGRAHHFMWTTKDLIEG